MTDPLQALANTCAYLERHGYRFALVGGLAVAVRAEIRFTRDVDLAVGVEDDQNAEQLIFALSQAGYQPVTTVEHDTRGRLATARMRSPAGVAVDLMFASTGIEPEIIERATTEEFPEIGSIPVARAEELLAMKLLSMAGQRLQDRMDAQNLVRFNPDMDLASVRDTLRAITERDYHRGRDLPALLEELLQEISAAR